VQPCGGQSGRRGGKGHGDAALLPGQLPLLPAGVGACAAAPQDARQRPVLCGRPIEPVREGLVRALLLHGVPHALPAGSNRHGIVLVVAPAFPPAYRHGRSARFSGSTWGGLDADCLVALAADAGTHRIGACAARGRCASGVAAGESLTPTFPIGRTPIGVREGTVRPCGDTTCVSCKIEATPGAATGLAPARSIHETYEPCRAHTRWRAWCRGWAETTNTSMGYS
jgi:hypothetical protein